MTPMHPPSPPRRQVRVRAGDDDRARAASMLADHYAQGRLDETEFDQRISRALTAVHTDELNALFTDLPAAALGPAVPHPDRTEASRRTPPRPRVPTVPVLAVVLVLLSRGAVLWLLPMLWWFAGPVALSRRHTHWHRPRPTGRPMPVGAGSSCRTWSPTGGGHRPSR